jgi:hypothetical protein
MKMRCRRVGVAMTALTLSASTLSALTLSALTMTALAVIAGCGIGDNRAQFYSSESSPQRTTPQDSGFAGAGAAAPPGLVSNPTSANDRDGAMAAGGLPVASGQVTEPPKPTPPAPAPEMSNDDEPDSPDPEPATEPAPAPPPCELGDFGPPEKVSLPGVGGPLYGPALSAADTALFFVAGAGTEQIFLASRSSASSNQFSSATQVAELASSSSDGTPFVSASGLRIYFRSAREGSSGGSNDLWVAERQAPDSAFAAPTPLRELNTTSGELLPRLSADELGIVFTSQRPDGKGRTDLWRARRSSTDAPFGAPENIAEINTDADETGGWLSSDGSTLFFSSNRPGGQGGLDIWRATRSSADQPFGPAEVMPVLNSPGDELDLALSSDEHELLLSSNRDGIYELWRWLRVCR